MQSRPPKPPLTGEAKLPRPAYRRSFTPFFPATVFLGPCGCGVGAGTLATHRQTAAMSQTPVAADIRSRMMFWFLCLRNCPSTT